MVRGDAPVSSLAVDAAGALLALTVQVSNGGTLRSSLLRSSDGGSTFDSFGPDLPDFVGAIAPTASERILAYGGPAGSSTGSVAWWTPGSSTWELATAPEGTQVDRIVPHPSDPEVLLAWSSAVDFNGQQTGPGVLWFSSDAAASWRRAFETTGPMSAAAFSPTGDSVLVGGSEGLFSAELDDLRSGVSSPFHSIRSVPVWGLRWDDAGFFVGDDEFAPGASAMLSRGDDPEGELTPLLRSCAVEFQDCPDVGGSPGVCLDPWFGPGGYEQDFIEGRSCGRMIADSGADSGAVASGEAPEPNHDPGCSCSLPGAGKEAPFPATGAAGIALVFLVRRRGRTCR